MVRKILAATAALTLGLGGVIALAGPASAEEVYATVTGHEEFSSDANHEDYWGDDCTKIEGGDFSSYVLDADYAKVVVKAGSGEFANTIFDNASQGETVWADTNGDGVYNPGGKGGDKQISHIIVCNGEDDVDPVKVTGSVQFTDPTCKTPDGAAVETEEVEGVKYDIVGDVKPGGSVTVFASASSDEYKYVGANEWDHTFATLEGCGEEPPVVKVNPAKPGFTDPTCDLNEAGINLPDEDGVVYTVKGDVAPGEKVVVTASLAKGVENTELVGNTRWVYTFGDKVTGCNEKNDPPKADNPPKADKPAPELPHTGANPALIAVALGLLGSGAALTLLGYRRKSVV